MLSLFDAVAPAVPPKLNVLATDIAADIFDVPVNVKPVAVAIDRTVVPAPAEIRTIEPVVPKAIERVLLLFEEKMAVVRVKSLRLSVPLVSVVVPLFTVVVFLASVTVAPPEIPSPAIVLLFGAANVSNVCEV